MLEQLPKKSRIIYILMYLLFGLLVLRYGPIYNRDSYAFLEMAINRSPVYSMFLKCYTYVFGDAFEYPLIMSQYIIMALAAHFLIITLNKTLKLHSYSLILFQIGLLANASIWNHTVNKILSEPIAYPLIIILIAFLFRALTQKSFSSLFKALIVLYVLMFTRGQFIGFIPVVVLIIIYVMYQTKNIKTGGLAIIGLALIPVLISFSERVYNKVVINQYKNYAMTYVHFISAPFYIANSDDVSIFETEEEKAFFKRTFNALEANRWTLKLALEDDNTPYMFFEKNFTNICNSTVHQLNMDFYGDKGFNEYEQQYKVDELTTKMFLPMVKANFKSWVKHVIRSFKKGVGGTAILFILLLTLGFSVWLYFKSSDYRFLFLILAIALKFANNLIIAMVVHSIPRYTYYFDWIIFAALILLLNPLIKRYSKSS